MSLNSKPATGVCGPNSFFHRPGSGVPKGTRPTVSAPIRRPNFACPSVCGQSRNSGKAFRTCSLAACGVSRGDTTMLTRQRPARGPSGTRP